MGWARGNEPDQAVGRVQLLRSRPTVTPILSDVSRTLHAGCVPHVRTRSSTGCSGPARLRRRVSAAAVVVADTSTTGSAGPRRSYRAHVEPGTASGELWWEPEWSVPALTRTVFDNAGRATAEVLYAGDGISNLVEKWRAPPSSRVT